MRQDPDIIMVGEIRDLETAEMAIQAALTGHLVLSTLHTNDAPAAITRRACWISACPATCSTPRCSA
jgi:general secretion pathway protein E